MKRWEQQPTAGPRSALLSKRETPDAIGREFIHLRYWALDVAASGVLRRAPSLRLYWHPFPVWISKIGGIHFAYPFVPLPLNRYLYHFLGADTPKDSDVDTMSEFFYFAVFGCWRCEYGLICPKISPIQALLCKISLVPGKTQFHPFSPSA